MTYVGIRQLKAQLGRYLRAVEAGETLTVTTRRRPIARVVPIRRTGGEIEDTLNRLADQGVIQRARRKPSPPRRPLNIPKVRITDAVLEDRGALL